MELFWAKRGKFCSRMWAIRRKI